MIPITVAEAARRYGDRIAYVTESGWSLSYEDLDRISDEVAVGSRQGGEGDVVARAPARSEYLPRLQQSPSSERSRRA
jgi:non-ribosomal peptide synthetase component E (peptide arylation enzyme)